MTMNLVPCPQCGYPRPTTGIGDGEISAVLRERDRYLVAIIQTLDENRHLADGEDCSLINLKRAVPEWE